MHILVHVHENLLADAIFVTFAWILSDQQNCGHHLHANILYFHVDEEGLLGQFR